MAKCRLLYQENEELGRMISSGRLAKLEGDLALQRNFSEEMKKSQSGRCKNVYRAGFIEPRAPGKNRLGAPPSLFFCLKTRFFSKKILKKSLFSFVVGPPSALGPWQPPGSPGGKDDPVYM